MKKYIKFLSCFLIFVVLALSFCRPLDIKAVSVPLDMGTIVYLLFNCGVSSEVYNSSKLISSELSDEENKANAEEEQYYLQQMLEYYETYGGDPSKISYMTADGSVVSLEKALQDVTTMSTDDYIEMRKQTPNPTKTPGPDWGEIFINNAVGGLMDFVASFLIDKKCEEDGYAYPATFYTGDSGYINRSTGDYHFFIEADSYQLVDYTPTLVKHGIQMEYSNNTGESSNNSYRASDFRLCIVLDSSSISSWGSSNVKGCRLKVYSNYYDNDILKYAAFRYSSYGSCCFLEEDYKSPAYLSTNLPVFATEAEAKSYLLGGSSSGTVNPVPYSGIRAVCNNYKNKIVTLNSVKSFGVTPTPTPSPTPKPTATPTPTPTPSPTPFPTWSGTGPENFTTYNFYTEISNILNPVQTTINNISQSITNIFNFFVIDTEEVSEEINNINVLPTSKFKDFVATFGNLKNTFSNENQDELYKAGITNQYGISYPVIKVQCPKILLDFVPDNPSVVLYENDICYLILCDCSKYATYFIKVRGFLKACIWFGMIFYLMRELKPVITLSD